MIKRTKICKKYGGLVWFKKEKKKRKEKQQSVDYIKNLDVNLDRNGTNDWEKINENEKNSKR